MSLRSILILLIALTSAGATGFGLLNFMNEQRQQTENANKEVVVVEERAAMMALVATKDVQSGEFIRPEDLEWQPWPQSANNDRYITLSGEDVESDELQQDAIDSFKGGVVYKTVLKGQPIQKGQVVFPGDRGFLAAVLEPDMKAISVAVSNDTGVSGLVLPGDRVDVLVSMKLKGTDVDGNDATRYASTTMLEDIRILAIDQSMILDEEENAVKAKTVTLEVDEIQARKVAMAREFGRVTLTLRSLAQNEMAVMASPTPDGKPEESATKSAFQKAAYQKQYTVIGGNPVDRNFTLDMEVFSINGRDMSLVVGRKAGPAKSGNGVVVLRGDKKATE